MEKLTTYLTQLENFLLIHDPTRIEMLQHGLSKEQIDSFLPFNAADIPSIYELFEWKNGLGPRYSEKTIGEIELFPEGIMMPLEEASNVYSLSRQEKLWDDNLFPILWNGAGDYYLIDFDKTGNSFGIIYFYAPSLLLSTSPQSIFDSIESMFRTVLDWFDQNAFYKDSSGQWEVDYDLKYKIAASNNPKSEFWTNDTIP